MAPTATTTSVDAKKIPPLADLSGLIHRQASYCWKRLPHPAPLEFEELLQEGAVCYLMFRDKFRPGEGTKFITPFFTALQRHLAKVLHRAYRCRRVMLVDSEPGPEGETSMDPVTQAEARPEARIRIQDITVKRLSRSAFLLCREILTPSDGFMLWCKGRYIYWDTKSPRLLKDRAARYLGFDAATTIRLGAEIASKLEPSEESVA